MSKKNNVEQFYKSSDLTPEETKSIVMEGLKGSDFGEFYQEISERESIVKNKGEFSISLGNKDTGFGFRFGVKNKTKYTYADTFNKASLQSAVKSARQILKDEKEGSQDMGFGAVSDQMYLAKNSMKDISLEDKIKKINEIEKFAKSLGATVENVSVSLSANAKEVQIITADGQILTDTRPSTSLHISIAIKDKKTGKVFEGSHAIGGPVSYKDVLKDKDWKKAAKLAFKQAEILSIAKPAPSGEMQVVLNQGWPGVLLHEAVGHGLEGDFNRKDISVYSGKIGKQVAHSGITVIDQGDMPGERGSLHFDDEGTPTQQNVLIENGKLMGYMQDRKNAKLMGETSTGNGRRESFRHAPMPRMTNTYFKPMKGVTHESIIASVKNGLYIDQMGGGSVNITSGEFNFRATLGYIIRDGKICEPVSGVTLVGKGLDVIKEIDMVADNLDIGKASGMCGKNGQSVPVGVGQPTIRVGKITVGGAG